VRGPAAEGVQLAERAALRNHQHAVGARSRPGESAPRAHAGRAACRARKTHARAGRGGQAARRSLRRSRQCSLSSAPSRGQPLPLDTVVSVFITHRVSAALGRSDRPRTAAWASRGRCGFHVGANRYTKDPKYDEAAMKVFRILESLPRQDGLMPLYLDVHKARFTTQHVSLGAMGDSAFEYLLKVRGPPWCASRSGPGRHCRAEAARDAGTTVERGDDRRPLLGSAGVSCAESALSAQVASVSGAGVDPAGQQGRVAQEDVRRGVGGHPREAAQDEQRGARVRRRVARGQ
jgi:hypothetical protein